MSYTLESWWREALLGPFRGGVLIAFTSEALLGRNAARRLSLISRSPPAALALLTLVAVFGICAHDGDLMLHDIFQRWPDQTSIAKLFARWSCCSDLKVSTLAVTVLVRSGAMQLSWPCDSSFQAQHASVLLVFQTYPQIVPQYR